jgi:hypothetical protein
MPAARAILKKLVSVEPGPGAENPAAHVLPRRLSSICPSRMGSTVRVPRFSCATNCDLCSLATCSWRLLSWISSNRRTFSMGYACAACDALLLALR